MWVIKIISQSLWSPKWYARDQCSGGAAPVQQIKSQVKSFSVLTSLVECQMSMYQELIIEMDIKNS